MLESTITSKGQTTLPKDIRDLLGVGPGDRIRYLVSEDGVRILRPRKVLSLCGSLAHDGPPVSLEAMEDAVSARAAARRRAP